MFQAQTGNSLFWAAGTYGSLVFHTTVRSIRKSHQNAVLAILINALQMVVMIAVFFVLFDMLGMRGMSVRGDFLLYVMSGIFVYMTHIKAVQAVKSAEGPTSAMMQHLPMTTAVSIAASALSSIYIQSIAMLVIVVLYHLLWTPIVIHDPIGAAGMLLMAWASGVCVGLVFLSLKPWFPRMTDILTSIYGRVNMFASGKMFVANQLPAHLVLLFSWNPLFHIIDQMRGYLFVNYNPHHSNLLYPTVVSLILLTIGLLGENFTRKRVSLSWAARQ